MLRPGISDFLKQARNGVIVPVVLELPSDQLTPVDAYYALNADYLLESAEKGMQVGRYSFLGVEPETQIVIRGEECQVKEEGRTRSYRMKDPLRMVGEIARSRPYLGSGDLSPFPGGAVGYVGYDMVQRWEKLPPPPAGGVDLPDAVFVFTRYTLVFDNLLHTVKIICNVRVSEDARADYEVARRGLEEIRDKLKRENLPEPPPLPEIGRMFSSYPRERFMETVQEIREMIEAGEAIQVVLSQRIRVDYKGDPFWVYRSLRSINPSPYMVYLNFEDFALFGASPELMVKVDNGRAVVRPIAGTRPRGKDPEEDNALKEELLRDEKERAEHLMLVDLARNDLGRIAKPGTVSVDRLMDVESYSHVMHIVSEVSAEVEEHADVFDVIRATFPAGTVSGAPKVRAMEILNEKEPVKRGPYAGLVGYLSYTGSFDSCITIRSVVAHRDQLYLQAGAGIVYDSDPEKEYQETINKARAILAALQAGREKHGFDD